MSNPGQSKKLFGGASEIPYTSGYGMDVVGSTFSHGTTLSANHQS